MKQYKQKFETLQVELVQSKELLSSYIVRLYNHIVNASHPVQDIESILPKIDHYLDNQRRYSPHTPSETRVQYQPEPDHQYRMIEHQREYNTDTEHIKMRDSRWKRPTNNTNRAIPQGEYVERQISSIKARHVLNANEDYMSNNNLQSDDNTSTLVYETHSSFHNPSNRVTYRDMNNKEIMRTFEGQYSKSPHRVMMQDNQRVGESGQTLYPLMRPNQFNDNHSRAHHGNPRYIVLQNSEEYLSKFNDQINRIHTTSEHIHSNNDQAYANEQR